VRYGRVSGVELAVSRLVIGSVPFHEEDLDACFATLDAFLEAGGNCVDLAHGYRGGSSQRAVGAYLKARGVRDKVVLLDKGCHPYGGVKRVSRECLASDLSDNLERLGVERIDLFLLHRDDPDVPVGDILGWLEEERRAGRIGAYGGSNWRHDRIAELNREAAKRGAAGFAASSSNLSLATPNEPMWPEALTLDEEAREWYERTRLPLFAWSAGGGGFFAGVDSEDVRRVYHSEANFARLARAEEVARRHGASATQVALAWTLSQPLEVFGIVGPDTPEQVRESVRAVELEISADERSFLEEGQ
jgi:1-deoxyxylulose-5-phosphate synthase